MHEQIRRIISGSDAHALATTGTHGINVVPVSVVELKGDEIHLYDFFMKKTVENLQAEPRAALTCWQGFRGVQVKAETAYDTEGEVYDAAVVEMKKRFPDRTLAGVIRLTPIAVYDIAPGASGENILK